MSNPTRIEGRIEITPPLNWAQIKDSPYLNANARNGRSYPDVLFDVIETTVHTDAGELTRREAVAIVPTEGETSARTLLDDVQAIIDASPGHEFTGRFQCEGEQNDDIWRVVIRDRKSVRVDAQITWPDESE
jgi:Family of unknown function (DUF6205)